ncbi:rho GTPase-activating protein 45 isoform X3 [Nematostella vectensis]|uniref:rho GTPase-activating protein 45 isoform X3 n=1 Tax=Nematostella vectensis TaxID=45351 RepID=UPI002077547C|nr:rho GTPase-activating protein 45 isoform X3 [Nematostella vectensis]
MESPRNKLRIKRSRSLATVSPFMKRKSLKLKLSDDSKSANTSPRYSPNQSSPLDSPNQRSPVNSSRKSSFLSAMSPRTHRSGSLFTHSHGSLSFENLKQGSPQCSPNHESPAHIPRRGSLFSALSPRNRRSGSFLSQSLGSLNLSRGPFYDPLDCPPEISSPTRSPKDDYHLQEPVPAVENDECNSEFEDNPEDDPPEVKAHERLGEVLSILKGVLNKYTPLHSTDILAAAGTLISKVKSHNYDESSDAPDEFCESIDQLALAFSSSVSDFLMGDQDMPMSGSRDHSRSLEDFCDDDEDDGLLEEDEDELDEDQDFTDDKVERMDSGEKREIVDKSKQKADELDRSLIGLEHGVDLTLQRCKIWSKYAKDIATYLERRAHLELEFTNKLSKLAQTTRAAITEERFLPFQSIFVTALDQDIEYSEKCAKTYSSLLSTKFLEPLQARRNRHEHTRKDLKDNWTKAYKKLNEAITKLEKAKQTYIQRNQELDKSKQLLDAKDGQEPSASYTRTTKKKQDDARKAEEAEEFYNQCVSEATVRQHELEKTKSHVLLELRQLVYQCDMTMKAVTCNYFQMMNDLAAPAPVRFQILAESSRAYEPGTQFSDFVQEQMAISQPTIERVFVFEPYSPGNTVSSTQDRLTTHHTRHASLHSPGDESGRTSPFSTRRHRSLQIGQHSGSSTLPVKAWSNKEHLSDVESNGSKSAPASPTGSPVTGRRNKAEQSTGLNMESSDEESGNESDEKEAPVPSPSRRPNKSGKSNRAGSGPFRDCRMSSGALTHQFKKLRAPSRCRDCDSYVYFNGAECEQCGLTCHKRCLARLTNKCSYKGAGTENQLTDYNRTRRMTTFGVDFYHHLLATDKQGECVPYIVSSCIKEINNRGLHVKGIYRVSGVKSRVEKLCQAFENGAELVDLSTVPPHVIAAVLKLYLRQLPEPLLTFKLYPEFIKLAKESFNTIDNLTSCKNASQDESIREDYVELVQKLRHAVVKLPKANFKTAAKIIEHLHLVAANEDENSMSGSNLGIVFGPTLLRPRESASSDSVNMSALMDMPLQTRTVELLITNIQVFDPPGEDDPASQETPVEDISGSERAKSDSTTSPGVISVIKGKETKGPPIETVLTTEDGNALPRDFNIPGSPHDPTVEELPDHFKPVKPDNPVPENVANKLGNASTRPGPQSTRKPEKISLGFGNDFFDLLEKSNEREKETEEACPFTMPEFLLPGSMEKGAGDESDIDDVDENKNTHGTSGPQTPEAELHRNSLERDTLNPMDFLGSKPVSPPGRVSPEGSPRSGSPSPNATLDLSDLSRRTSLYSTTTVSFGSDLQDTESLLPDLSDKLSEKKSFESFEVETQSETHRIQKKTVDDAAIPNRPKRPQNLGLFKRNSDLPGMISRGGFFPLGVKNFGSEPDVAQKGSEKKVGLFSSKKYPAPVPPAPEHDKMEKTNTGSKSGGGSPLAVTAPTFPVDLSSSGTESQKATLAAKSLAESEEPTELESKRIEAKPKQSDEAVNENGESCFESKEIPPPSPDDDVIDGIAPGPGTKSRDKQVQIRGSAEDKIAKSGKLKQGPPVLEKKKYPRRNAERMVSPDSESKANGLSRLGEGLMVNSRPLKESLLHESAVGTLSDPPEESERTDENNRLSHRVSVKDRRKQYEQPSGPNELNRKSAASEIGSSEVASRKQTFEESGRNTRRDSYKRLNDLTKKARSSTGLDGSSGTDTGSDSDSRKGLVIGRNLSEQNEKLDLSAQRREKVESSERPRSLVLEPLRLEKIETPKHEKHKTAHSLPSKHSDDIPTFTARKVDIPLDSPEPVPNEPDEATEHLKKPVDKSSGSANSLRSSPKPSRSTRPHFPEKKSREEREPQFV